MSRIGIVIIGRNEGERLRRCLASVAGRGFRVVYVDSGSTDGSIDLAEPFGAETLALDPAIPFAAGRARNEGFEYLMNLDGEIELVQFVDGDCELAEGWLQTGASELSSRRDAAVVCGRRRERFPCASIYNLLCHMEWNTPVGEALSCGGDSMMRVEALRDVGGFDPGLIAGEEPELCFRLRQEGWKILRIDAEMSVHDAAMTRFGQWWRRSVRCGHGYGEGAWSPRRSRERIYVRQVRSALLWGAAAPGITLASLIAAFRAPWALGVTAIVLAGYVLLAFRIRAHRRKRGDSPGDSWLYAAFCILGKFPESWGILLFLKNRFLRRSLTLVEYKTAGQAPEAPAARQVNKAECASSQLCGRPHGKGRHASES